MKDEDDNEQQLVLTINEPIDAETEYPSKFLEYKFEQRE